MPGQVEPRRVEQRGSQGRTSTGLPRVVPSGENQIECSFLQAVTESTTTTVTDTTKYWRPWLPKQTNSSTKEGRMMAEPSFKHLASHFGGVSEDIRRTGQPSSTMTPGIPSGQYTSTTRLPPAPPMSAPRMPRLKEILLTTVRPYQRVEMPYLLPTTKRVHFFPTISPTPIPAPPSQFLPYNENQWIVRPAGTRIQMIRKRAVPPQIERPPTMN